MFLFYWLGHLLQRLIIQYNLILNVRSRSRDLSTRRQMEEEEGRYELGTNGEGFYDIICILGAFTLRVATLTNQVGLNV